MAQLLSGLPKVADPRVIVGYESSDDAGVFRLGAADDPDAETILSTVDYFTPVVESPFDFGRIAAANSLSDIYAMGGEPLFALNLVGFPTKHLPLEVLQEIVRGGSEIAKEARMPVLGGHSTDFDVPFFGLAVTGRVALSRVRRNVGGRPGDALVLTKAVGTGILTSAMRARALARASALGFLRGKPEVAPEEESAAIASMARLNRAAARALDGYAPSACTDVTGYGLLGHLREMVARGGVDAEVSVAAVPILPGARRLAAAGIAPAGSHRNLEGVRPDLEVSAGVADVDLVLLADAQTSGGLLVALPEAEAEGYVGKARESGDTSASRVGRLLAGEGRIHVIP